MKQKFDVCGIGNLMVDILMQVDDNFVRSLGLKKGNMTVVDETQLNFYLQKLKNEKMVPGGCVGNTLVTLAGLGYKIALVGSIGNDKYGNFYAKDLKAHNVVSLTVKKKAKTGVVLSFITPDCQRTFATYLGASTLLSKKDVDADIIKKSRFLYLTGYELLNTDAAIYALDVAKRNKVQIAIDLADSDVVLRNRKFFKDILKEYAAIVLANEKEAQALTGKRTFDALDELAKYVGIAVVKRGVKGSLIKSNNKIYEIPCIKVKAVDTTGAGDNYAAGILYGILAGKDLYTTGKIASLVAARKVCKIGARFNKKEIAQVRKLIKNL